MKVAKLTVVLRQIAKGEISRGDAAETLGRSEREVNRLMRKHGVQRPASPVHAQRAKALAAREAKTLAAEEVIAGSDINLAAKGVCSVRTLYRLVGRLRKSIEKDQKR